MTSLRDAGIEHFKKECKRIQRRKESMRIIEEAAMEVINTGVALTTPQRRTMRAMSIFPPVRYADCVTDLKIARMNVLCTVNGRPGLTIYPDGSMHYEHQEDEVREATPERMKIWECKIGEVAPDSLVEDADSPMRKAIETAYKKLTGKDSDFIFSGWGGELSPVQRRVVGKEALTEAYDREEED